MCEWRVHSWGCCPERKQSTLLTLKSLASWTTKHESITCTRSTRAQQAKAWRGSVPLAAATKYFVITPQAQLSGQPKRYSFQHLALRGLWRACVHSRSLLKTAQVSKLPLAV